MKYNYVIFASKLECYKYMYQDATGMENVKFYSGSDDIFSKVEKVLHSIHVSRKINRVINLPFKNIWYHLLVKRIKFSDNKPICFIWSTHFMKDIENGMIEYIKKALPDSKHVFQFTDAKFIEQDKDILQEKMDLLTVFDNNMANLYGLKYWPNVYPTIKTEDTEVCEYDICFVGNDRGREDVLKKLADKCEMYGIKTAFFVKKEVPQEAYKGIQYITEYIPYEKTLELVKKSRCVLELKVEPYNTCSLRVQEAIILNKKILTNNTNVFFMPCCENGRGRGISCFENIDEIDWDFLKKEEKPNYRYSNEFSLTYCLKRLETEFI